MGRERSSELDRVRDEDLGTVLREEIQKFLDILGVPRGLAQVGYTSDDVHKVSFVGRVHHATEVTNNTAR